MQDHEEGTWTAVLRSGKHKLIWGQEKLLLKERNPEETCRQRLFNLLTDPSEEHDLMERGPNRKIASMMRQTLMDAVKVWQFSRFKIKIELKEISLIYLIYLKKYNY